MQEQLNKRQRCNKTGCWGLSMSEPMTCACLEGVPTYKVVRMGHDLHVSQQAHALLAALVIWQGIELCLSTHKPRLT